MYDFNSFKCVEVCFMAWDVLCLDMCFVVTWWECILLFTDFLNVDYILLSDTVVEFYICDDLMASYSVSHWEGVLKSPTIIIKFSTSFCSVSFSFTYFTALLSDAYGFRIAMSCWASPLIFIQRLFVCLNILLSEFYFTWW